MIEAVIPFPNIDPVLIHIYGPISIRWYALSYIAGLLLGWWYVLRLLRDRSLWEGAPFKGKAPATADDIGDLFVWITLGVIIGGRLGFVLFYGVLYCGFAGDAARACGGLPGAYLADPVRIIAAWEGGMSFHGGLLGVVIAIWWFCRRRKLDLFAVSDLIAAATPIGLFFGRIANFINGELWGKVTDAPWGMTFCNDVIRAANFGQCPAGQEPRHPSQLYEALLEGVVLFLILRFAIVRLKIHHKPGSVVAWFLLGYGAFRFVVEFFRDSESMIYGWFSMGQLLSIPMWAAALFFLWYAMQKPAKSGTVNALKRKILTLIEAQGPLTVAQYMAIALGDPEHGYYMRRDPLGRDFITAPEISQIFGELIGLFFMQAWEDRGRPTRFDLVELGPGRGTLMADMIRAAAKLRPQFGEAARITLVETSPTLRAVQQKTLASSAVHWVSRFDDVPADGPLFLVANEFFDALPIRQFVKSDRGWHERMVTSDDEALRFMLTPDIAPSTIIPEQVRDAPSASVIELNPLATALAHSLGERIAASGGVALIIDYGHGETAVGETLQAVKSNAFADLLSEPGEADLTAHVDFGALATAASDGGACVPMPSPQGSFLEALGIRTRADRLKRENAEKASEIDSAVDRLTNPKQMGTMFKALAIFEGRNRMAPPGFNA